MANKTAIVTGASSGIGAELACTLAADYKVFACGRNQQRLQETIIGQPTIEPLLFDITEKQQIVDATANLPALDLIVLNAGGCEYLDDPLAFDDALFERVIQTNLIAVGYCLNVLMPKLKPGGQIVFIGSSVTYFPFARAEAYGASKAGVNYLANALRQTIAAKGYTVTLVEPGFVSTPLTDQNDFDMPFLVSAQKASSIIARGIQNKKNTIRFPKRLIWSLQFLNMLPRRLSSYLTRKD